jgi:hypothetical protein
MDYQTHIETLLAQYGIEVDWRDSTRARSWRKSRRVRLCRVKTAITYATALHEIGHVVGHQSGRRIDKEAQAWRWAETNAIEWREPMMRHAARCIRSYLVAAARGKSRMWVPPQEHDAHAIAAWAD